MSLISIGQTPIEMAFLTIWNIRSFKIGVMKKDRDHLKTRVASSNGATLKWFSGMGPLKNYLVVKLMMALIRKNLEEHWK